MPAVFYFENTLLPNATYPDVASLKERISQEHGVSAQDLFVTINGKPVPSNTELSDVENVVRVFTRLVGGKGGFGSMLRSIGAQIKKTTNNEACRDLSGRRFRDINEEKRLQKWLEGQEEREREAAERKQQKLERLIAEPKIYVKLNPMYEKDRQELHERVSAAVDAGWQATSSSNKVGLKRKTEEDKPKGKKKAKLWIDAGLSDCSSSTEDEEEEVTSQVTTVSSDSGNESDRNSESSKV